MEEATEDLPEGEQQLLWKKREHVRQAASEMENRQYGNSIMEAGSVAKKRKLWATGRWTSESWQRTTSKHDGMDLDEAEVETGKNCKPGPGKLGACLGVKKNKKSKANKGTEQ